MNKNNPKKAGSSYAFIPTSAIEAMVQKKLSKTDMMVYVILSKHYNWDSCTCWPGKDTIAKQLSMDSSNVKRSIKNLCAAGVILKINSKKSNGEDAHNIYYLPQMVEYEIEKLSTSKKSAKTRSRLNKLRDLQIYILSTINQTTRGVMLTPLGGQQNPLGGSKQTGRGVKEDKDGGSTSPTNNTTINSTNNITINVAKTTDDLTSDLTQIKNHKRSMSINAPQHIGDINSLINLKNEGLAQEIASVLNDHKSIQFFRSIVSKFVDHEDIIRKCLSLTRETEEITGIKKSKGAVFTDTLKREGLKLGIEV